MSKILLIGASSAIAQALQENSDKEFIALSRSAGTLDLEGDLSELDDLGPISGMVYFPGTINLKPFAMLKKILKLMHPFAPFITEEINELIFKDGSLMDL